MSNSRKHSRRLVGLILALIGLTWPTPGQNNPLTIPTWSSSGPPVPTYSLAIDPANPHTVYAGGAGKVFKSLDGGATWHDILFSGNATVALAIDRTNPQIVYAGCAFTNGCYHSDRRLFKSVNGGESWSDSGPPINGCDNIHALVLHPANPNILYVANFDDVMGDTWTPLITSPDAGATWNPLYGPPFAALAVDPYHAKTIYAGTFDFTYFGYEGFDSRNGVLKSTDGGVSWRTTGLTNTAAEVLVVDPVNPNTLYAVTRGFYSNPSGFRGIFKSTDGGGTWSAINNGLAHLLGNDPGPRWPATIARASFVVHPTNTTTLYAGFPGSGVFKSVDGGANWSQFNDGLTNLDIRALALAPGNPSTLYAATAGGVSKIIHSTPVHTNAIDDARFYVRQHYLDFLNREPDQGGWDYWTARITECGNEPQCVHERRIGVSAAFFVELEFQETGYVVYRLHRAAYGEAITLCIGGVDLAGTPCEPRSRAKVARSQFVADRAQLVDGPGLPQSTINLANNFVQRPEFKQLYPEAMAPSDFVNKLFDTANLTSSANASLRQTAIDALTNGSQTRAQVLLDVIEISEFKTREYNPAFVLMQYFGYLGRDPDEGGYYFWLNVLNNRAPNNFGAMVCAFLTSSEYQLRFGSAVTRSNADCNQSGQGAWDY